MQLSTKNGMRLRLDKPSSLPHEIFTALMKAVEKPHKQRIVINLPPKKH